MQINQNTAKKTKKNEHKVGQQHAIHKKKQEALGSNLGETLKPQEFKQSRKTQREQREGERKGPGREE